MSASTSPKQYERVAHDFNHRHPGWRGDVFVGAMICVIMIAVFYAVFAVFYGVIR